jgi:pyruvate formate lyase activating enzyme
MASTPLLEPGVAQGRWWHELDDGRIQCDLCPRLCKLRDKQRGFCFVRQARNGEIALTSYGRATGFCIDPVEKKPLYHFHPGSAVLSFGTAGCNLGCRYCQNWDISKAREDHVLSAWATPEQIADAAVERNCRSVAFTYNDPIIFAEYVIDTAQAAHAKGLSTIAVSNGYMMPKPRNEFYARIDAANIDLKGFTEDFYRRVCYAHLEPVLDTLRWLRHRSGVWLEITNLLIPGHNDSDADVDALCRWVLDELGPDVPLHFSAFSPAYRMLDVAPTPVATVLRAHERAMDIGLQYVYAGNIVNDACQTTQCPRCCAPLIVRNGYHIEFWDLQNGGNCACCGAVIPGHFDPQPGNWGARRVPLTMFSTPAAAR